MFRHYAEGMGINISDEFLEFMTKHRIKFARTGR